VRQSFERAAARIVLTAVLALGFSFVVPTKEARAVERQHHLGGGPSFVLWKTSKSPVAAGIGISAGYTYGITDALNLMAEFSYARTSFPQGYLLDPEEKAPPKIPLNRPQGIASGLAGVSYVFDVVRWVPYVGGLIGVNAIHGGNLEAARALPVAVIAAGFDYQWSRHVATGFAFRQHFHPFSLSEYPTYSVFTLRAAFSWGY
jgi:hypothetical protein